MSRKLKMGRPPLYETPEQLQEAIDRYFLSCQGDPVYDKKGNPITDRRGNQKRNGKAPTISGLSQFLGFKSRHSFVAQKSRSLKFNDVVLEARTRIESYWEMSLYNAETYQGACFALSLCFGWRKQDTDGQDRPSGVRIINRIPKENDDKRSINMHDLNIMLMN